MEKIEEVGRIILGAAINVHSHLGPGLLESAYEQCLCYELKLQGLTVQCEVALPLRYRDLCLDVSYRVDMIVDNCVLIENKCVDKISPVHEAQLLTYLRLTGLKLGYVLNWNVSLMKDGMKRMVNNLGGKA
ncbi:GxxExxY protein [Geomonas propionica]|uniref:GxxExxY protein n=1 Tax=Geomonas propionica TaxID=2798582 RepID=A0ABS0YT11_9BACT|nr:GxxExxY protein [Geomonas propionica]MBJ6801023.1 GxxExxY protein [Geomonas propionica]